MSPRRRPRSICQTRPPAPSTSLRTRAAPGGEGGACPPPPSPRCGDSPAVTWTPPPPVRARRLLPLPPPLPPIAMPSAPRAGCTYAGMVRWGWGVTSSVAAAAALVGASHPTLLPSPSPAWPGHRTAFSTLDKGWVGRPLLYQRWPRPTWGAPLTSMFIHKIRARLEGSPAPAQERP